LGLINVLHLGDSWYIEYKIKDDDEPRYQVLSPMNEDKLKINIENYLNSSDDPLYLDGSYNFVDVIPSEIESIKIVDNTKYSDLKAYDNNDNPIEYKIDKLGRINQRKKTIRHGSWFPYFHEINNLDLSKFQILSKDQLDNNFNSNTTNSDIFCDHCFVNCLKYYKINNEIIEYVKDIIFDILRIKNLNKLCKALNIIINLS
jgi:hypothetical protein